MKTKNTQNLHKGQSNKTAVTAYSEKNDLVKKEILSVRVTSANKDEILEYILNSVKNSSQNYYVVTPNPEMMVYAASHPDFTHILNGAELALCDGVGLFWGAKVLGTPLKERFAGVELVESLCVKADKELVTIGFFGGRPGVAEKTAECLQKKHPNLRIVYINDGWEETYLDSQKGQRAQDISMKDSTEKKDSTITTGQDRNIFPPIDILFVALGFPKQEEWMASHLNTIPVRVMVGVGGAFDYISGRVPRAPKWVQNIGLEWLFRLIVQPWRIKRQLALPKFVWMVLREKMGKKKEISPLEHHWDH